MEEESRNRCPNCGSGNIAKIIWGLPDFTVELQKRIDAGEIVLGGCIPGKGDFECKECGLRFRSAHSVMDRNRQE